MIIVVPISMIIVVKQMVMDKEAFWAPTLPCAFLVSLHQWQINLCLSVEENTKKFFLWVISLMKIRLWWEKKYLTLVVDCGNIISIIIITIIIIMIEVTLIVKIIVKIIIVTLAMDWRSLGAPVSDWSPAPKVESREPTSITWDVDFNFWWFFQIVHIMVSRGGRHSPLNDDQLMTEIMQLQQFNINFSWIDRSWIGAQVNQGWDLNWI